MSVLVKGMKMPECCWDCNFCKYLKEEWGNFTDTNGLYYNCKDYFYCDLIKNSQFLDSEALHGKHPDCPIVPVPPHGRLIDADALMKSRVVCDPEEWDDTFRDGCDFALEVVRNAPTIIEAGESEDG